MSRSPRNIVFHVPSLMPEDATRRRQEADSARRPSSTPVPAPSPAASAAREGAGIPVEGGEVRKLATLLEVSQALAGTLNLQAGLYGALEVLERRCGARRGAVTLIEEASGLLVVEAALGYPRTAGRVRYRVGEGITGGVAQRGTPAVVPHLREDTEFLHRAARHGAVQKPVSYTHLTLPTN